MTRITSTVFKASAFGQQTDEAVLCLVTIDHDDLATPVRITSDAVNTTSNGNLFVGGWPFALVLPDDPEEGVSTASIEIDNVELEISQALRRISTPCLITIQIVLAGDPDTVEAEFPDFELIQGDYDVLTVTGSLALPSVDTEPYPGDSYTPSTHPGQFL